MVNSVCLLLAGTTKIAMILAGRKMHTQYYLVVQRLLWVVGVFSLFQVGWHIYGNTFHYGCDEGKWLWTVMMGVLAIGYVTFVAGIIYIIRKVVQS